MIIEPDGPSANDRSSDAAGADGAISPGADPHAAAATIGKDDFQLFADNLPTLCWIADPDGYIVWYNRRWHEYCGTTPEQMLGWGWQSVHDPAVLPDVLERWKHSIASGEAFEMVFPLRGADGVYRPFLTRAQPYRDANGSVSRWFGVNIDIAGQLAAEGALRESEERLRAIFNATPECIKIVAPDGSLMRMNHAGLCMIEAPAAEPVEGACVFDLIAEEHRDDWRERHRRIVAGESLAWEFDIVGLEGTRRRMETHAVPLPLPDGQNAQLAVTRDITHRKDTEEALLEESRTLETLNRTGAALAGELDLEKVVQMVTDAGVELTGAKFGAFFYNVINEGGEALLLYTLSGAERSDFEHFGMPRATGVFHPTFAGEGTIRSNDITKDHRYGTMGPHHGMPEGHLPVRSYLAVPVISRSGEVIGGLFFGHPDEARFTERHERLMLGIASQAAISIDNARLYQAVQRANETLEQRVVERTAELERANEALRQAQKMEAIGQLTGGIAHDFNNMLTVIRGSTDVLRREDLDPEKRARYLDAIADTSDRAARLTGQLLAFARRQALRPEKFDVSARVDSIADMLRTVLGSRIRLRIEASCTDCFVEADASQFETAILNMAVNARDAMDGEGELAILVGKAECLPEGMAEASPGGFVSVAVTDSGHGIAADALDKIFEPFFTTKEVGKGTGLGLSQVYGFAKQSGGEIDVRSATGQGTTFTLFLPQTTQPDEQASEPRVPAEALAAGGRVLVVEDNAEVGQFAEQVLADLGLEATLAMTADAALAILEEDSEFDIVFSDVVMPGMSGIEFARLMRKRRPELPVVLTSGYSHVLAEESGHGFPLLHKPYSVDALSRILAEALSR